MTSSAAYEILGLTPKADKKAIKKRYRYLMHHVHPDSGAFKAASGKSYDYRYSAQEINAAYSFLYKNDNFKLQENIKNTGTAKYTEKNTKYSHNNSSDDAASNNSSDFNYSPKNKTIWKAETNSGLSISSLFQVQNHLLLSLPRLLSSLKHECL